MANYNRGGGGRGGRRNGPVTLPDEPPFTAFVGHLPQGIIQSDIEDIFQECGIAAVRLVHDRVDNSFKGYCYVEFNEVSGLEKALEFNGANIEGKTMKVDIAEQKKDRRKDDRGGRGGRGGHGHGGYGGDDRRRQNSSGYDRQQSYNSDRGPPSRGGYNRNNSQGHGDGQYNNFRGGDRDRNNSYNRQPSNQSYGGGGQGGGYGGNRRRMGSQSSQGSHGQHGNDSAFAEPAPPAEPTQRRRLNLKARTKPVESADAAAPVRNASIFGTGSARDETKSSAKNESKSSVSSVTDDMKNLSTK